MLVSPGSLCSNRDAAVDANTLSPGRLHPNLYGRKTMPLRILLTTCSVCCLANLVVPSVYGQAVDEILYQNPQFTELASQPSPWREEDSDHLPMVRERSIGVFEPVQQETANQLLSRLLTIDPELSPLASLSAHPDFFVGKPMRLFSRVTGVTSEPPESSSGNGQPPVTEEGTRWVWLTAPGAGSDQPLAVLEVSSGARFPDLEAGDFCGWLGYVYRKLLLEVDGNEQPVLYVVATDVEKVGVTIPRGLLAAVQNREPLESTETDAYYRLLFQARFATETELERMASEFRNERIETMAEAEPRMYGRFVEERDAFPAFVDLFKHPDEYQGRVVTLHGRVREVVAFAADPNPYGLKTLYEIRMFPDDGQRNPAIVVCSELPEGFPVDASIVDGVSVTGYCFKVYAYPGQDPETGKSLTRFAPMLLAHELVWDGTEEGTDPWSWWLAVGAFVAAAVLIPGFLVGRNYFRDRSARAADDAESGEPDFGAIAALEEQQLVETPEQGADDGTGDAPPISD